jgi:hypothetical protein
MNSGRSRGQRRNFTGSRCSSHASLTCVGQIASMISHRMKIRANLRSVRVSALSEEERRKELREAEARNAHAHPLGPASGDPPLAEDHPEASEALPGGPASIGIPEAPAPPGDLGMNDSQ